MSARGPGPQGIEALADRLGHRFVDPDRLAEALTHGSAAGNVWPDNQRLEFLGDRVLGLVIAEALLSAFPEATEGELAPRLNALVRRETLAEIAGEVGLGRHLRLGRSESLSGGRKKAAILADAMEAVIAAVYEDGGLDAARRLVVTLWAARIAAAGTGAPDAKTRLQEWAQARGFGTPDYRIASRSGPDHAPRFVVEATLSTGARASGEAGSRKAAEQAAAAALLANATKEGDP